MPSFDLNVNVYVHSVPDPRLDAIQAQLATVISNQEKLLMDEQQVLAGLQQIDAATTAIAGNITNIGVTTKSIADVGGTIKSELEALLAAAKTNPAIPQSVSDALTSLVAKTAPLVTAAQAATDALALQVPALQGIATEGVANAVPVTPTPVNPGPVNPPPPPPPPAV